MKRSALTENQKSSASFPTRLESYPEGIPQIGVTSTAESRIVVSPPSARKTAIKAIADQLAGHRDSYIDRAREFHEEDYQYLRFLIPEGAAVLEIGCATGRLLAALRPSRGVGVDLSSKMIEVAASKYPELKFVTADIESPLAADLIEGKFDFIVMHDTMGTLEDCQTTLVNLRRYCHSDTRVVIAYYSFLWEPLLNFASRVGLRAPTPPSNWLKPRDIANLLDLADYEVVRTDWRQLIPFRLLGIGRFINRFIGTLPGIRKLCIRNYLVARPLHLELDNSPSVSIVVPCRNERGNIEAILQRIPEFCDDLEIIFVEGNSQDGTYEEIERLIPQFSFRDVKLLRQTGKGKGDAVYKGFDAAKGDVLMILDADLSVPPEQLPKFYDALRSGKGEFVHGSRLVYPMENEAMRALNLAANHVFSTLFTWLLNQRFTDTLCGTKVLHRRHYQKIRANRSYFGDFDPFGDFDLIFGASKLNLKMIEVPITYAARVYGETQISRFSHGWLLLRMVVFGYFKFKVMR